MDAQTFTNSQQTSSQDQMKSYVEGKINEREIFVTIISFLTHVVLQMMWNVRHNHLISTLEL